MTQHTPSAAPSNPFRHRHAGVYAFAFVAVITAMAALLVAWSAKHRIDSFQESQRNMAVTAAQAAANEIELLVTEKRRLVRLFANEHVAEIAAVATDPENDDAREALEERVQAYFPEHFGFTLTDGDGAPRLPDFDGLVGEVCLTDIRHFVTHNNLNDLFVHPNPEGYHFDIMAAWRTPSPLSSNPSTGGIFFVSFPLDGISRLLRHGQIENYRLMLVRTDAPDLVEIDAIGGRNQMLRNDHLTLDELAAIEIRRPIPDTRWDLVALPDGIALAATAHTIKWEAAGIMVLFLMASGIMLLLVGQAEHHRSRAEATLRETNHHLNDTVTNLRDTQRQLIESEKMAALGGLVKGIAHEINTPLGVSVTAASHLQDEVTKLDRWVKENELTRSRLSHFIETAQMANQMVLANLGRTANLVSSFKQVAGDQAAETRREFDLGAYLAEVETSLQARLLESGHHLEIECPSDITMDSYPGALAQVVTHLVLNALEHAFPPGDNGLVTLSCQRRRQRVRLSCADNGRGMSPDFLAHAFEPFVTTARGSGSIGLGLHIAFTLVTGPLGGRITCESTGDTGTTFHIDLPAVAPGRRQASGPNPVIAQA